MNAKKISIIATNIKTHKAQRPTFTSTINNNHQYQNPYHNIKSRNRHRQFNHDRLHHSCPSPNIIKHGQIDNFYHSPEALSGLGRRLPAFPGYFAAICRSGGLAQYYE